MTDAAVSAVAEPVERRRRLRSPVRATVKLYDPVTGCYFGGQTCDVSETGMRLTLPARLPAYAGYTAHVILADASTPGFVSRSLLRPVRFVWVRRDPGTGAVDCGVEVLADAAAGTPAAVLDMPGRAPRPARAARQAA